MCNVKENKYNAIASISRAIVYLGSQNQITKDWVWCQMKFSRQKYSEFNELPLKCMLVLMDKKIIYDKKLD